MSNKDTSAYESSADRTVAALQRIDEKVNAMRLKRENDRDTLFDKIIKAAIPALMGLIAGKAFEMIWKKQTTEHGLSTDDSTKQGLVMSVLFAGASAALSAIISELSNRGSQALVDHRHNRD